MPPDGTGKARPSEAAHRLDGRPGRARGARASSASAVCRRGAASGAAAAALARQCRHRDDERDGPRPPPLAAPLPPATAPPGGLVSASNAGLDPDGGRRPGHARGKARASRDAPGLESAPGAEELGWTPLPPSDKLEALIQQTAREIAELESQEQFWADSSDVDEDWHQREPELLPSLAPVEAPTPPRIQRLGRERRVDPKWARLQKELVDPIESSRAYLDRICRPQPEPVVPHRLPQGFLDEVMAATRNPLEDFTEILSYDPLEFHIRSLCRPW